MFKPFAPELLRNLNPCSRNCLETIISTESSIYTRKEQTVTEFVLVNTKQYIYSLKSGRGMKAILKFTVFLRRHS